MPSLSGQMSKYEKIEAFVKGFKLSTLTYKRVMHLLTQEMNNGLHRQTNHLADIKMFPTFVRSLPDGSERGQFLALDLGGTNFRVLLVKLNCGDVDIQSKTYLIPQRIMLGTGQQLFDHIAECIGRFIRDHQLEGQRLPLGFTFSFPCRQEGLARARLSKWTKGFRCEGVVNEDICQLLREALERRTKYEVEIVAVVNDAVGTLMSAAHGDKNCQIGLILGTGCNACYMEKLENVSMWEGDSENPEQVIINTEWGAFGDNGCLDFIRTEYDRELDNFSINPGKQVLEKMIAGMYMGETVRLVLERLTMEGLMFQGTDRDSLLFERGKFYTKYISEVESDHDDFFGNTKQVLGDLGVDSYTAEDCKIVKYVCTLVSARAAFLSAAGLSTLINRLGRPEITIAVDGSLYRFHPRFHNLMCLKIRELVKPGHKFKLSLSHDGSGKGAALVAAVAMRLRSIKCEKDEIV